MKIIFLFNNYIMSDQLFESCMKQLKEKLVDVVIDNETIMTVLRYAMEIVELTELKGKDQKDFAIKLVRQVVVDAPISDDKEKLLLDIIDSNIIGNTVDLVVDASRGKLDINAATEVAQTCCQTKCFGLFGRRN